MKKYVFLIFIILGLISCKELKYDYNLKQMGRAVDERFLKKDLENNTQTKIEIIRPISYVKIAVNERSQPEDAYLGKIYVKGTWSYMDSNRIYNIDDTIKCYFDENLTLLRVHSPEDQEE